MRPSYLIGSPAVYIYPCFRIARDSRAFRCIRSSSADTRWAAYRLAASSRRWRSGRTTARAVAFSVVLRLAPFGERHAGMHLCRYRRYRASACGT